MKMNHLLVSQAAGLTKNAGGKYEGFSHYVVENTESGNVNFRLAIMLLKNKIVRNCFELCD
jgi:hypothetical protein